MSTKVALQHRTTYRFDRAVAIGPHLIRLRPAAHTRTPIESYSLDISPAEHFLHWQQDPFGNHVARVVFPAKAERLEVTVSLVADLAAINPFDFLVEGYAETFPFSYPADLAADLEPYLRQAGDADGPVLGGWLAKVRADLAAPGTAPQPVVGFLAELNSRIFSEVAYSVRMEVGVLSPEETLRRRIGSCRDSAWLLVAALRHFGLAARFVSGYLVQLAGDPDGPAGGGPGADLTDLHAWAEVYLPGAGWVGLDATSALFAGEGHIPLSATPQPSSSAPISGAVEVSQVELDFSNTVRRVAEDPRMTSPHGEAAAEPAAAPVTVLGRYLAAAGQPSISGSGPGFDELAAADGTARAGWAPLLAQLDAFVETDLVRAGQEVARLLADDGVTHTPTPASSVSIVDRPVRPGERDAELATARPWALDPLPLVLDAGEWAAIEVGVVQRAELLGAILADLYGAQRLLSERHLPAAAVLDHDEFLRPLVGIDVPAPRQLFLAAADLGRDGGQWKVMADRTQAPSGVGYAMENRRVVSRVLPQLYREAHLHRLTPFFHAMRMALVDAAPQGVEDPKVVVLSPGPLSETAFDQAFVASLLGFPLVEGSDLTVRDGRVWMRALGRLEPVDVILRRVDSTWSDPLELRAGSRLGVVGLTTAIRQGSVSVVNNLGSGVLENPAMLPYLPELCQRLLGEPLRLPSVDTWWCGDPASLSHVLASLDSLVIRPLSRNAGRSVLGSALTRAQRERLTAQITAAPHRFVGQEVLRLSSAPTSEGDRLVPRDVVLRSFAVRQGGSYTAMLGGLGRVVGGARDSRDVLVTPADGGVAKDVWVLGDDPVAGPPVGLPRQAVAGGRTAASFTSLPPRVLSDLYWFGRYAERTEDLLRLLLAARTLAIETDLTVTSGPALEVVLKAVTHVSTTYPGFLDDALATPERIRAEMPAQLRALLVDRRRLGTAAQSLAGLTVAAQGVRDQLSADVWMVLAEMDRAVSGYAAAAHGHDLQLAETGERVLSGLLALSGIVSENMVRDTGWHLLDIGRGLERALQLVSLLEATLVHDLAPEPDRMVVETVMTAAESIVTFRRRYRGRVGTDAVVELLVVDEHNPRSVSYQLDRIAADLRAVPAAATSRPLRLLEDLAGAVRAASPGELVLGSAGERPALRLFLGGLHSGLNALAQSIDELYLRLPGSPKPMWRSSSGQGSLS